MSEIQLAREFMARGFTASEVRRMSRAGELERVRRGAYVAPVPAPAEFDPRVAHRRLIEATIKQSATEAAVSHGSAAALHGLPVWPGQLVRVHLTRDRPGGGRVRRYTHLHGSPLEDGDLTVVQGVLVTSLARTVVDLACDEPMERSVAVGDAALRLGLDSADLAAALDRAAGRHGIGAARRAIAFLDQRSESPGESTSRVVLYRVELPQPDLQFEVRAPDGSLVARSDFGWAEKRTVGEFDGFVKYGRLLKPGQEPGDVVFAEKRREDAIRDLDWQVVRWVTADLATPRRLRDRVQAAFERGMRNR